MEVANAEKKMKSMWLNAAFWLYLKRWLGVWTCWENFETRKLNCAFWRYLNRCFGSWNCWDNFENKNAYWCILTVFETMTWEYGTAEKTLKPRMLKGAFWLNLKRWFGSWICKEYCEIKVAKHCLLTLFETSFWKLGLLRKF